MKRLEVQKDDEGSGKEEAFYCLFERNGSPFVAFNDKDSLASDRLTRLISKESLPWWTLALYEKSFEAMCIKSPVIKASGASSYDLIAVRVFA